MDPRQLVPHERPLELLLGTWQRSLTTRHFGTFVLGRDASCVVAVEQVPLADVAGPPTYPPPYGGAPAAPAPGYRLRWSFGRSPGDVRAGYHVEPLFDALPPSSAAGHHAVGPAGSVSGSPRVLPLRVTYGGAECVGTYQPDLGLMMVHLTAQTGSATVLYRLLDDDTLAVSITEVPGARRAEPSVQHGFMFRLPPQPG